MYVCVYRYTISLRGDYYIYLYFTDKETKAERSTCSV